MNTNSFWPDLPLTAWSDTCETLHRWTQVAGKVRLKSTPLVNHWWNVTFHLNSRGLVAPANIYNGRSFDIVFDFVDHLLRVATSDGRVESFALAPMSVADFAGHRPDVDVDVEAAQTRHELRIEIGNRHRRKREAFDPAVAGRNTKEMIDEVEDNIEAAPIINIRRCDQAARIQMERHIPPMIDQRGRLEPHLACDLRPAMQGLAGIGPRRQRQVRPERIGVHHGVQRLRRAPDGNVGRRTIIV